MSDARPSLYSALRWKALSGLSKILHRASNWFYAKAMKA